MERTLNRAYRYRLYPTEEQASILMEWANVKRFVWNKALGLCETRLDNGHAVPRYAQMSRMLTLWKQAEEWTFLKQPPKDVLQNALRDLDGAFAAMFNGLRRKPRFKRKRDSYRSFRLPSTVIRVENNRVMLPKQREWIPFRRSRRVKGKIVNATVSFDGRHWHISFQCEVAVKERPKTEPVGIDVGTVRLATLSDGSCFQPLDFSKEVAKLEKHQRAMSRRVKGSGRWLKAKARVLKTHRRIADKRNDHIHKVTTKLATASLVAVENLNVKNMSASASGTLEAPGRNVAQKRGLNRSILAQGWALLFSTLEYKIKANGGVLVRVSPEYSSQECSKCHYTDKANRETQSRFVCKKCGFTANADHNAAKVILARGLRVAAQGKAALDAVD